MCKSRQLSSEEIDKFMVKGNILGIIKQDRLWDSKS